MFRLRDPSFVRRGRGGRAIAAASTVVPVVCLFTPAGLYPTWPPIPRNFPPHLLFPPHRVPLPPQGGRGEAKEFFHVTEPLSGLPSLTKGRKCHRAPWGPQPHWTIC